MPRKTPVKVEFETPPEATYTRRKIAVGVLNTAANTLPGPQRDTAFADPKNYRRRLKSRWRQYGPSGEGAASDFNWLYLTDRIVSARLDPETGKVVTYYPLDGNGSSQWVEELFGPRELVYCRVIELATAEEGGVNFARENRVFQAIQDQRRPVTRQQKHDNNAQYDPTSEDYQLEQVMKSMGFHTSNKKDAYGIGSTPAEWVLDTYFEGGLRSTLAAIATIWPDTEVARTNGSVVRGLAKALHDPELSDHDLMFTVLRECGPAYLAGESRGRSSENPVWRKIRALMERVQGAGGVYDPPMIEEAVPVPLIPQQSGASGQPEDGEELPPIEMPAPAETEPADTERARTLHPEEPVLPHEDLIQRLHDSDDPVQRMAAAQLALADLAAQEAAEGSQVPPEPRKGSSPRSPRQRSGTGSPAPRRSRKAADPK